VTSKFARALGRWSRDAGLALLVLGVGSSGCGSSERIEKGGAEGAAKLLKPEELYRYEGTGNAKKKVAISRREKVKLLREAAEKRDAQ
jgi:hypothetical protein